MIKHVRSLWAQDGTKPTNEEKQIKCNETHSPRKRYIARDKTSATKEQHENILERSERAKWSVAEWRPGASDSLVKPTRRQSGGCP